MSGFAAEFAALAEVTLPPALVAGCSPNFAAAAPGLVRGGYYLFEFRLSAGAAPIDLAVSLQRPGGGPERLTELADGRCLALAGPAAHAWQRIGRLARAWGQAGDPLAHVDEIGLEYDYDAAGEPNPVPAVFAGIDAKLANRPEAVDRFLNVLLPGEEAARARCRHALDTAAALGLPPGRMIGVMLSRRPAAIRLMMGLPDPEQTVRLLEALGWAGDGAALARVLDHPMFLDGSASLVLGFAPDLCELLGIEFIHSAEQENMQRELLAFLPRIGLADPAKVAALDGWTGWLSPDAVETPWPRALVMEGLCRLPPRVDPLRRRISHVKLSISGGRLADAKVYLALSLPPASRAST